MVRQYTQEQKEQIDAAFDLAFEEVVGLEGDFTDDPSDSGGATRYGITESVARRNGYSLSMSTLPLDFAKRVYRKDYWEPLRLSEIVLSGALNLALEMFECGVNLGIAQPAKFLQTILNACNDQEDLYRDVIVDGKIGTLTLNALNAYLEHRGDEGCDVLVVAMNCLQGVYYLNLAQNRPKDERFVYGWLKNRLNLG